MERNRQQITVTITVALTLALTQGTKPTLPRLFKLQNVHLTFNLFSDVSSDKREPTPSGTDDSNDRRRDQRKSVNSTQDSTQKPNSRRHSSIPRHANTHCTCKPIPTHTPTNHLIPLNTISAIQTINDIKSIQIPKQTRSASKERLK
jgi:hypothetical protein